MITGLRVQGFRSYSDESFEFGSGVNIIVGPNASGKTNLLEAVLVAARGRSYRASDGELVHYAAPWARIDADTPTGKRVVKLVRQHDTVQKDYIVGDVAYRRLPVQKTLPVVIFEPNHLMLLAGAPELRRDYLDTILEQTIPGYGSIRRHYRRALSQRNALLKQEHVHTEQLFAWNIRLSQLGGQIAEARLALINRLATEVEHLYQQLSRTTARVTIEYQSSCSTAQYSSDLLHRLESGLERDIARGFTGAGPHRDDMAIRLDGHPIESVASRGEIRTLLLVLKIIELRIMEAEHTQKPILLLDDVFSELDSTRRHALTTYIETYQTFITTTDADAAAASFADAHTIPLLWRSSAT